MMRCPAPGPSPSSPEQALGTARADALGDAVENGLSLEDSVMVRAR